MPMLTEVDPLNRTGTIHSIPTEKQICAAQLDSVSRSDMESLFKDPNSKSISPDPQLDLYTIPSHSSWFCWDEIHETERVALKEFFDGSSISRTPKVYKEYRDFIINKYREDPSRRLSFTEVRKSLVGDVSVLHKVFLFLEKWGLINFGLPSGGENSSGGNAYNVKIEEGAPNGIRVVAGPNSFVPLVEPSSASDNQELVEGGFKLPPLASYSDVFDNLVKAKGLACGNCREQCDSKHYEHSKGEFIICEKCFDNGNYGENKSKDDFKLKEGKENSSNHGAVWTEAEMLLLLESVMKHGDDWELVAQDVKTKTKLDCISKLIELPFGDIIFSSSDRNNSSGFTGNTNSEKVTELSSSENEKTIKPKNQRDEETNGNEQNGDATDQGPSPKKQRVAPLLDAGSSLLKQVAHISTMVSPHITAAAANASFTTLCGGNSYAAEIFDGDEDYVLNGSHSPMMEHETERSLEAEDSDMKKDTDTREICSTESDMPVTLRIRAAVGTALGTAAARAKLLADQEDREIEHLVATIIETQVKKLQCKVKHLDEAELIMEKEHTEMEAVKESMVAERIDVLQKVFDAGISRWRDRDHVLKI